MSSDLESYQSTLNEVVRDLDNNDPQSAFRNLRVLLRYPGDRLLTDNWQSTFELFGQICQILAGDEASAKVRKVAENADDINALYELGYDLIEFDLPELAATVLARANALAPGYPQLLAELVCALEGYGLHAEACRFLRAAPEVLTEHFLCRYLLAFNSIMTGELNEARQILPSLQTSEDENEIFMADRIVGILRRADMLEGCSSLDWQDLRGWHYVLTNGLLLHLSPYGFAEGMNGRYAYIQDSYGLIREGIHRAIAILNTWQISISKVSILPDRNSEILARAIAQIVDCPLATWDDNNIDEPGLIVAYDLGSLDGELLEQLAERRPGQILWSHATCWTQTQPIAADLTTYLYQHNVAPWERGIMPEERDNIPELSNDEIVSSIVTATIEPGAIDDLDTLLQLADRVKNSLCANGYRLKQFAGSPVPSSRFI